MTSLSSGTQNLQKTTAVIRELVDDLIQHMRNDRGIETDAPLMHTRDPERVRFLDETAGMEGRDRLRQAAIDHSIQKPANRDERCLYREAARFAWYVWCVAPFESNNMAAAIRAGWLYLNHHGASPLPSGFKTSSLSEYGLNLVF